MIYVNKNIPNPLNEQIYLNIAEGILNQNFKAGDRLPATRKLAAELSVSRNTVISAYQQLQAEGYISSIAGSGFTVNDIPLEDYRLNSDLSTVSDDRKVDSKPVYKADFIYGALDNSSFPYSQWRKSLSNALDIMEHGDANSYPNRQGELFLRQSIADYLYKSRGVCCDTSQIVITAGHQYSMEIIANIFHPTNKNFAIENPGYDGIRIVFENQGYNILPVELEKDGVRLAAIKNINADLLYLTPSHQFPTGSVLPINKRKHILQWAYENNTYIIEDDYDSELRYYTNPIPAMYSLDNSAHTIYAGTFSKSLSPALRIAYLVLPKALLPKYKKYYHRYNSYVSLILQLGLADFISSGNYERHLNRIRTLYRKKQKTFLAAINKVFGPHAEVIGDKAGIHILLNVNTSLSHDELLQRAHNNGIKVYSPKSYYFSPLTCPENQLLLGFATISEEDCYDLFSTLFRLWIA
jgi:GntR family transcriptional regulator/MocR family aminotransferase